MNKKLIKQLYDDFSTADSLAEKFLLCCEDDPEQKCDRYEIMCQALEILMQEIGEGDIVTVQGAPNMWARGAFIRKGENGDVVVKVAGVLGGSIEYTGKIVDLVIEGEEGEADV